LRAFRDVMSRSVFDYFHNFEAMFGPELMPGELAYDLGWGLEQNDSDSESDDLLTLAGMVCFLTHSCPIFRCKR
jgi:hypothetical protein